jgi:hypothetical protein
VGGGASAWLRARIWSRRRWLQDWPEVVPTVLSACLPSAAPGGGGSIAEGGKLRQDLNLFFPPLPFLACAISLGPRLIERVVAG